MWTVGFYLSSQAKKLIQYGKLLQRAKEGVSEILEALEILQERSGYFKSLVKKHGIERVVEIHGEELGRMKGMLEGLKEDQDIHDDFLETFDLAFRPSLCVGVEADNMQSAIMIFQRHPVRFGHITRSIKMRFRNCWTPPVKTIHKCCMGSERPGIFLL